MKTRKTEWFDNASFWRELYPFMFPEKDMAEVDANMGKALQLAKPSGKRRWTYAAARADTPSFWPSEVSPSPAQTKRNISSIKRVKEPVLGRSHQVRPAGHARFRKPPSILFRAQHVSSFGYFEDKTDDTRVLGNIFASLEPGGVLLMDLMNKKRLAKMSAPATPHRLPDGSMLAERRETSANWIRIRNERQITRNGKTRIIKSAVTVYSAQRFRAMLRDAGFVGVKFYGNLDGDPHDADAPRLVATARKPKSKR